MVLYLTGGWYTQTGQRRLRDEVVDGAIDSASTLFQAGVRPNTLEALALKIRALAAYAQPQHGSASKATGFTDAERQSMRRRLQLETDSQPALQCFIVDCLEHVENALDLRALYLHLVQIAQMMQMLLAARGSGVATDLLGPPSSMPTGAAGRQADQTADGGSKPQS